MEPPDAVTVNRTRRERGRQRPDLIGAQPAQRYPYPVLDAAEQPLGRLIQPVDGPAVDHHRDHRIHR